MNGTDYDHHGDPWAAVRIIVDQPLLGKPTLMQSLSWERIQYATPLVTFEIIGITHFKGMPLPIPETLSEKKRSSEHNASSRECINDDTINDKLRHSNSNGSTESCEDNGENRHERSYSGADTSSSVRKTFPPPLTTIGTCGRPWVCFKSYREDGRLIIKEVRIPRQQCLRATRENGRFQLHVDRPPNSLMHVGEDDNEDETNETDDEVKDRKVEPVESRLKNSFRHPTTNN